MQKKAKNRIIALLLVLLLQAPAVSQLIHIFDNEHGIVYFQEQDQIQQTSNADCSVFHQELHYLFTLQTGIFNLSIPFQYPEKPVIFTIAVKRLPLQHFQLRAPPFIT